LIKISWDVLFGSKCINIGSFNYITRGQWKAWGPRGCYGCYWPSCCCLGHPNSWCKWCTPPSLPIAHLGVEWLKDDYVWCYKIKDCVEKYSVKWFLTLHLKKMHSLAT
jgi:hypothetical protein